MDEDLTVQAQEATPLRLEGGLPDAGREACKNCSRKGRKRCGWRGCVCGEEDKAGDTAEGRGQGARNPDRLRVERIQTLKTTCPRLKRGRLWAKGVREFSRTLDERDEWINPTGSFLPTSSSLSIPTIPFRQLARVRCTRLFWRKLQR